MEGKHCVEEELRFGGNGAGEGMRVFSATNEMDFEERMSREGCFGRWALKKKKMSSGGKGAAGRALMIPSSVKETIENIKEITGQSHTDEEIYAMLKECSMDPNETTQKLLLQDTFHEVKRKRDRRKEHLNKESAESRSKPGVQTRVNRGGQRDYSSQYVSRDGGRGRNLAGAMENATSQISEKDPSPAPLPKSQDAKSNETTSVARSITDVANGPSRVTSLSTSVVPDGHASGGRGVNQIKETGNTRLGKSGGPPVDANRNPTTALGPRDGHQILNSSNRGTSLSSAPSSGVHLSSSDLFVVPSQDSCLASALGTIKHEVESQRIPVEQMADTSVEGKSFAVSATEVGSSIEQKMPSNCQGAEKNNLIESPQTASSTLGGSSITRPSSNSNNRPQEIDPPKVGTGKEWRSKSTSSSITHRSGSVAPFDVPRVPIESHTTLQPTPNVLASRDVTLELQRKLDKSHISDNQQVIIPSHLHVPEVEKLGFCFGSFDASFGLDTSCGDAPESDENSHLSKYSEAVEETDEEQSSSHQSGLVAAEDTERKYPYISESSSQGPKNFPPSDGEVSFSVLPEYTESKQEVAPGIHQLPLADTSSNYGFGFTPPILSSHLAPLESSESQARDVPTFSGFVAQQSFDLTSYYAQFYRPDVDVDGRTLPFSSTGAATKYNGNAAGVSSQISPSPQESSVPLVLSTAAPTSIATQASGIMQNSITASQQPLPVFQQPTGVHLPHYPPNYFPYGPYLSPFYVPQPAIHQFLSNSAFPQQPQTGTVYPTPPGAATKYSISQYIQGPNAGNATHIGMPGNYGTYGLPMPNYASSSATTVDNLMSSEDISPQSKENINVSSQQGEGSSLWFTTPSQDISTLQAGSFYNLPQGQLAFSPTQPGQGAFTGIFHSVQPVTSATVHPLLQQPQSITTPMDMMRPTASVHQQAQLNQVIVSLEARVFFASVWHTDARRWVGWTDHCHCCGGPETACHVLLLMSSKIRLVHANIKEVLLYLMLLIKGHVGSLASSYIHSCTRMAERSRKGEEKSEKSKIVVPELCLDAWKNDIHSTPSSPVTLRKTSSVRHNCLCSPTTHTGSFRCRYHRNHGLTRGSISVGSKLSELAGKSTEICDAFNNHLISGHKQGS
ncbi:unnamed protein product [Fraxinus pennsylvanica]|uniref:GBF-interacting protein 1 N-terminal domain-containing protein n=1 Tax=Fraxinus pennsylvanica TaxID=56036 RepID=A0AAD1ZNA7_9LAMI|nr:unnamed protein product [Fraxinus pennsylvanica]